MYKNYAPYTYTYTPLKGKRGGPRRNKTFGDYDGAISDLFMFSSRIGIV